MVNFYRRNIPHAAHIQRRLQALIKTNKKKDRTPVEWTNDAREAFDEYKAALSQAVLLAHPKHDAELVLNTDASNVAIGGALQQIVNGEIEPLAFGKS